MMKFSVIHLFVLVLLLVSCSKEQLEYAKPVMENQALADYLVRFEQEAALRGINLDLASLNLTYSIEEIAEPNVAGYCQTQNHVATDIVIDAEFFNSANDVYREMVIFHELGHCVLYRNHKETTLSNGACASIMRSGLESCNDAYGAQTRAYYLDELFSIVNSSL